MRRRMAWMTEAVKEESEFWPYYTHIEPLRCQSRGTARFRTYF
jgi:hypothetical protein